MTQIEAFGIWTAEYIHPKSQQKKNSYLRPRKGVKHDTLLDKAFTPFVGLFLAIFESDINKEIDSFRFFQDLIQICEGQINKIERNKEKHINTSRPKAPDVFDYGICLKVCPAFGQLLWYIVILWWGLVILYQHQMCK